MAVSANAQMLWQRYAPAPAQRQSEARTTLNPIELVRSATGV
jgi:hypothetical protein